MLWKIKTHFKMEKSASQMFHEVSMRASLVKYEVSDVERGELVNALRVEMKMEYKYILGDI